MDGRVIARGDCGVDNVEFVFAEEVGMFETEGNGLGFFGCRRSIFAGTEHEEEADDAHVLDAAPLVWGESLRGSHAVEFGDDGGIDWPYSVGRRIFSGKGLEHFFDAGMVGLGGDGRGARGRVHHPDDFLADGTEVFSHCASSCSCVGAVEVASADADEEDLEVDFGPLDPNEMAIDTEFATEIFPMGPARGLGGSSGFNH